MLQWGQRKLSSDKELREVRMHVITQPAGLFGFLVGRAMRFRVDRFTYTVTGKKNALQQVEVEADSLVPECEVRKQQRLGGDGGTNGASRAAATRLPSFSSSTAGSEGSSATAGGDPQREKDKNGIRAAKELDLLAGVHFEERIPLTFAESNKLVRRARGYVLDVPRYPFITFDVEAEDAASMSGTLHLHGESHSIRCIKAVDGSELSVRCPVSLKQFHIVPFKLWLGLFGVADTVVVETRIPADALKL